MKKFLIRKFIFILFLLIFCGLGLTIFYSFTQGTNTTIWDRLGRRAGGSWQQGSQNVKPQWQKGQTWDLEGFFLNNKTFTLNDIDFKSAYSAGSSSELFLEMIRWAKYGINYYKGYGEPYIPTPNPSGLDFDLTKYDLWGLNDFPTEEFAKTYYTQNEESNASWHHNDAGILGGAGDILHSNTSSDGGTNGPLGGGGSGGLGSPSPGPGFTPENNSNPPTPTPEPATMILLGSGLIGLAWFGRKKLKKGL